MKDFEKLWRAHYPALRRLARSVAVGREDSEDLLSDTALRALQSFDTFEEGTSFHNWTCRIMANVWLNTLRDRMRRVSSLSFEDLEPEELIRLLADGIQDRFANVLDPSIEEALQSLDRNDVLVLVAVSEGETPTEIASDRGWSASRARVRVCRARERACRALLN